jgi:uncharacterized protein
LRRCIVTRERLPKEQMLRFVLSPDGVIVPDLAARLPGRGFWLSARRDVLETARAQGILARAFARSARRSVSVPADLPSLLEAGLVRRIGEQLGLARRAGQAVAGFAKAREWLDVGRAGLVVQALDGSVEERARFLSGKRGPGGIGPGGSVVLVAPLTAASLGAVFGRDHVVHVAVAHGRLAEMIANEAARLSGVTTDSRGERNEADAAGHTAGSNKRIGE